MTDQLMKTPKKRVRHARTQLRQEMCIPQSVLDQARKAFAIKIAKALKLDSANTKDEKVQKAWEDTVNAICSYYVTGLDLQLTDTMALTYLTREAKRLRALKDIKRPDVVVQSTNAMQRRLERFQDSLPSIMRLAMLRPVIRKVLVQLKECGKNSAAICAQAEGLALALDEQIAKIRAWPRIRNPRAMPLRLALSLLCIAFKRHAGLKAKRPAYLAAALSPLDIPPRRISLALKPIYKRKNSAVSVYLRA